MHKNHFDVSSELLFQRFNNGMKLVRPYENAKNTLGNILKLRMPIYLEDKSHITIHCNEICAEKCGFISMKECVGQEWFKPFKRESLVQSLINDKTVIKENKYMIVEEFSFRKDGTPIHTLSVRMPWYDRENKIIGLFGCSILLDEQNLSDALMQISAFGLLNTSTNIFFQEETDSVYLSKREKECLCLTVRGKSAKHIAQILGISHRTVEEYLANIKIKMKVSSKSELIDKAIACFGSTLFSFCK